MMKKQNNTENNTGITLRSAGLSDLSMLQHWDQQPHVIAADPNDTWEWETELRQDPDWREMLIAEFEGRPIGFIQIINPAREESHYWGKIEDEYRAIDIWIGETDDLGKGYGSEMMKQALNKCFSDREVKAVFIDPLESNIQAIRFYERLGFRFVKKQRFGKDDCLVYRMNRDEWSP